ncbi:MAG: hypothetical protein IT376_17320 [Polyangiaceae bacterium]|nr:hypothetical protein [Polyangiaceae bacterium]
MTERPISDRLCEEIQSEFPDFAVRPKAGDALSRAIDGALRVVTLGAQDRYLTEYFTVLGATLYTPPGWDSMGDRERAVLLRHERVHLRQRRRLGRLGMAAVYLIPFLPLGLAYGRARLEWEAYEETLRATAELLGPGAARDPALRERIVGRFLGPDYGWMWPFRRQVERWFDAALGRIEAEGTAGRAEDLPKCRR